MSKLKQFKQGDFVRLSPAVSNNDGVWLEIMGYLSRQQDGLCYKVHYWSVANQAWGEFTLAPNTAHKGMIAEHLSLTKEVADIFRESIKC